VGSRLATGRRCKIWSDENEIGRRYYDNSAGATISTWLMSEIVRRQIEKPAQIRPKSVDNNLARSSTKARRATLDRLTELPLASVALFGHGQFMQAVRWSITSRPLAIDADAMRAFHAFDLANPITNCAHFTAITDGRIWSLS
jgi:hypothetical protein